MAHLEGFPNISAKELVLLTKVCQEHNDGDLEQTLRQVEFIDRALGFLRSRALLNYRRPKIRLKLLKTAGTWLQHDLNMLLISQWPSCASPGNPYEMMCAQNSKYYEDTITSEL